MSGFQRFRPGGGVRGHGGVLPEFDQRSTQMIQL
jgi:hypothetical protein